MKIIRKSLVFFLACISLNGCYASPVAGVNECGAGASTSCDQREGDNRDVYPIGPSLSNACALVESRDFCGGPDAPINQHGGRADLCRCKHVVLNFRGNPSAQPSNTCTLCHKLKPSAVGLDDGNSLQFPNDEPEPKVPFPDPNGESDEEFMDTLAAAFNQRVKSALNAYTSFLQSPQIHRHGGKSQAQIRLESTLEEFLDGLDGLVSRLKVAPVTVNPLNNGQVKKMIIKPIIHPMMDIGSILAAYGLSTDPSIPRFNYYILARCIMPVMKCIDVSWAQTVDISYGRTAGTNQVQTMGRHGRDRVTIVDHTEFRLSANGNR